MCVTLRNKSKTKRNNKERKLECAERNENHKMKDSIVDDKKSRKKLLNKHRTTEFLSFVNL